MATNPINMATVVKEMINNSINNNNPFIIAKVKTPPPALTLEFGGQVIPSSLIYCSNYLLPNYKRDYRLEGTIDQMHQDVSDYQFDNTTRTRNDNGVVQPHDHGIVSLNGSGTIDNTGNYKTHGQLWFTDTLTEGVEVLAIKVGDMFVVQNRIVKMESEALQGGA